jgi:DNA sulfur modification protein DndE
MFSHIKTSKENKEVITKLTNKLNLGAENVIARIALAYSLAQEETLDLKDLRDSGGKEYSKSVLFGDQFEIYVGMICSKYNLHSSQKDLSKYIKIHIDHGLRMIEREIEKDGTLNDFEFIKNLV